MYQGIGNGAIKLALVTATTTVGGAAILPHTVASPFGAFLAYAAIGIGLAVLISQVVVRVLRRIHRDN